MMTPMPVPKSMQQEPGEADKFIASMLPGVGTAMDVKDIADTGQVDPLIALGLLPGGGLLKKTAKGLKKIFRKADDAEDLAAAARQRVEPKFEPGKAEPRKAEAPKTEPKPKVTVKPGETMDQAILRTEREKIARARNDQVGAKVWRPGGEPKVWRRGSDEKVVGPSGSGKGDKSPGGGKPPGGDKEPPISPGEPYRPEIPGPTDAEKKWSRRGSAAVHTAAALAAILGLKNNKDTPPSGGAEAGADDSGVTWVDTKDFVPTDTVSKDAVTEPKSSAAVTQEPARAPEAPIPEPDIALDQVKPPKKTDVTRPDEKSADPERVAPKKEKSVPVPEPTPAPPAPSEKTVTSPGSSRGRTDTPSTQPKKEPGTTPGGTGTNDSPGGTGPAPGKKSGSGTGSGTEKDYKYDPSDEILMREAQLRNKYQNFLPEDQSNPAVFGQGKTGAELQQTSGGQFMNRADRLNQARVTAALGNDPKTGQPYQAGRAATNLALAAKFRNQSVNTSTQQMAPAPDGGPQNLPDKDKDSKLNAFAPNKTPATDSNDTVSSVDFKYDPSDEVLMREAQLQNKYQNFLSEDSAVYEEKQDPRQVIEQYLGKRLSNSEYSALLRTINAESTKNPQERALVASVILNRAKLAKGDVIGVLNTPFQFQPITGGGSSGGSAYTGSVFQPKSANARRIDPGLDQEVAAYLNTEAEKFPGLLYFASTNPLAFKTMADYKKNQAFHKNTGHKLPNGQRYAVVGGTIFSKNAPPPYNPNANKTVQAERKLGDKFRDPYADLVVPGKTNQAIAQTEPSGGSAKPKKDATSAKSEKSSDENKPGYYTVGDSHGQGIAVYGKGKDGPTWINKSKVGASVVDKDQFATHMANIESIPPGSVVTISGGANDIARPNHQAIVDNLNKLIAASKARGHKVVYVLPTESPDPAKQQQREALRQTILKGVKDVPIVDLGMASKKDKQQVHLDDKGYNRIANNISDMLKPGVDSKPIGTIVQPDYSKYKVGDLGPLEKIGPNQWRSTSTGQIVSDAPELENLPSVPKPETFLDKVKRTLPPALGGKGELVSQVFGDKKKPAAATPAKTAEPTAAPAPNSKKLDTVYPDDPGYDERMEKLQTAAGDKFSQERAARLEKERRAKDKQKADQTTTNKDGVAPPVKSDKSADVTSLLQKDQRGLKQAKRELSDFEREFAARRAKGESEFTWYTKDGKPYQVTTRLKGETPSAKVSKSATVVPVDTSLKQLMNKSLPVDQSLDTGEKIVDVPAITSTSDSNKFTPPAEPPKEPKPSEIQQAMRDFEREQAALDPGEEIVNLDDKITAMKPELNAPGQNIDWKTIAPELFKTDKDDNVSSTATFKESINTTSNADLHDILRLAGRLK
jgi:hypothetical protein